MTDQWTPTGDKWPQMALVMVVVRNLCGQPAAAVLVGDNGATEWLPVAALRPMPPTITPEQQAVIVAVEPWFNQMRELISRPETPYLPIATRALFDAFFALRASQQPPDPVAEVVRLLKRYRAETPLGHQPHMIAHEVDVALAALEAKS